MPSLSIILVNWNTQDLLLRCLRDVYHTAGDLDLEVILVDNASSDGSVAAVRRDYPQVHIIENRENAGFARANNQGMRAAHSPYLLLLNTDAFVHPGTLQKLVAHMESTSDTGVAGCRLYYEDGRLQRSVTSFPTLATELWQALFLDRLFPRSPVFGKYQMTYWEMEDLREVDSVMGAVMILRRKALDQVGLFDEGYFMYSEEVDLCYRIKKAGWKVRYLPDATATHIWGGSARKVPAETFLRLYRSRVRFFRQNYGSGQAALYKGVLALNCLPRVVFGGAVALVTGLLPPPRGDKIQNSVQNYWRLLRSLGTF